MKYGGTQLSHLWYMNKPSYWELFKRRLSHFLFLSVVLTVCIKGLLYYVGPGVDKPTLLIEDGKPVVCEVRA